MYDELTEVDIRKMEEEISYRTAVLRPKLIEDVQITRSFGDLSENFEYKCAKRDKNRNDSRIRYLQQMIQTAKLIRPDTSNIADQAGLFDTVVIVPAPTGVPQTIRIVTTLRQDALKGLISKESPVAKAVLGHRAGEVVRVELGEGRSYELTIKSVEKGADDPSLDISGY